MKNKYLLLLPLLLFSFSFVLGAGDGNPPTYNSQGVNSTVAGEPVDFFVYAISPLNTLNYYWLEANNSGDGVIQETGLLYYGGNPTEAWANATLILNDTVGKVIAYRFRLSETDGDFVNTDWSYLTVTEAGDTTPPYFTSAPEGTSVGYNVPIGSSNFDAEDETAFDTFAVNDSEWTIDDDGTLQPPQGKAVGTYQVLITINDTSNNINTTTFTLTVTKNNQACSLEFRDGDGVFYNILSSPQEYGTSLYVWSGCDGGQFYVDGIPQSTGWFNNLEDGIYNFTVIRNSENYENYYSEVLFEILPQGIEAPQGVRKFWIFDKLEKPTITGEAISEGTSKFSLMTFFQNIWNWIRGLFI